MDRRLRHLHLHPLQASSLTLMRRAPVKTLPPTAHRPTASRKLLSRQLVSMWWRAGTTRPDSFPHAHPLAIRSRLPGLDFQIMAAIPSLTWEAFPTTTAVTLS